jgi:rubrerythrin
MLLMEKNAIKLYEDLANKVSDNRISKILLDVANEEKEHVGEILKAISSIESIKEDIEKGKEEAKRKVNSNIFNIFKVNNSKDLEYVLNAINDELNAINTYETFLDNLEDKKNKEITEKLIKDEKTHVGEFIKILDFIDAKSLEYIQEGKENAEKIIENAHVCCGNIHKQANFKFDPNSTENEGRYRIRDPKEFKEDSFRRWKQWAGVIAPKGVTFIVGELKDTNERALQAIRFNRKYWDEKEAGKFIKSLEGNKGFERKWKWNKKKSCFLSLYSPFYKIASKQDLDKISILMLDDIPNLIDFSKIKGYFGVNLYKFNDDIEFLEKNAEKINTFLRSAILNLKDRFLGVFVNLNKYPLSRYASILDSNRYIVDISNQNWYTIDTISEMDELNGTFWRKSLDYSYSPGDIDYYDIKIEKPEDVDKLEKFLYNIEMSEPKNKIINIEYRGVDKKIIDKLTKLINKEFTNVNYLFNQTKYLDKEPVDVDIDKTSFRGTYENEIDTAFRYNTPPNLSQNIDLNAPLAIDYYYGNEPKVDKYTWKT